MKTFRDRVAWLESLPKGGVCAEVGVLSGDFANLILEIVQPVRLHLIDVWLGIDACGSDTTEDGEGLDRMRAVSQRFASEIKQGRVMLHQGLSSTILELFLDRYFDWIYIDGDHSRDGVGADLTSANTITKHTIAGHDYDALRPQELYPGVAMAVDEFCECSPWQLAGTTEMHPQAEHIDHRTPRIASYILERK